MKNHLYETRVAQARRLTEVSEENNWALAKLTFETIKDGMATAIQWAEDIALSPGRVNDLVKTWDRYADPAKRMPNVSFNDHAEIARVTDAKAQEIIAFAEKTGKTYGIARKTISRDASKIRREQQIAEQAAEQARKDEAARISALAREEDLDAALEDTGNALVAHNTLLDASRKTIVDSRANQGAREATKPLIATASQMLVTLIPRSAKDLLESIKQANSLDLDIEDPAAVLVTLRSAVEEIEFHAAKRSIMIGVGR